jgi:hypothetical protein
MIVYQRSPQYTYNRDGYASAKAAVSFSVPNNNAETYNLFESAHADKHFMVVDASGNMSTIPISQANTKMSQLDNARRNLRNGITNFANQFAGITIDNGNFTTTGSINSGGNITTSGGNITTGGGTINTGAGNISTTGSMTCGPLTSGDITSNTLNQFLTATSLDDYQTQTQNDARYVRKNVDVGLRVLPNGATSGNYDCVHLSGDFIKGTTNGSEYCNPSHAYNAGNFKIVDVALNSTQ